MEDRIEIYELAGHSGRVNSLCLLSYDLLASGSDDKTIKIWSLKKWRLVRTLKGQKGGALQVITFPNNLLASLSDDETIRIWNHHLNENNLLITIQVH